MQSTHPFATQIRNNLPSLQTSFIGCEAAIATIKRLLESTRLLTITGSGGSGKTRLALRVAEDALDAYPGDVCWVDLAPLSDPSLVPQVVADTLGLREQVQRSYIEILTDYLLDHSILLVLDNCEHLRTACANLLATLLRAGTQVRVLATSREPLAVEGEQLWLAPMLGVPDARTSLRFAELVEVESVRLFEERAKAVAPTFTLNPQNIEAVVQICRRLDGMPPNVERSARLELQPPLCFRTGIFYSFGCVCGQFCG